MLYEVFPFNVEILAKSNNEAARAIAGRNWLLIVQAVTYRGYTVKDIENYLYAQSRNKTGTKAYNFDLTRNK